MCKKQNNFAYEIQKAMAYQNSQEKLKFQKPHKVVEKLVTSPSTCNWVL